MIQTHIDALTNQLKANQDLDKAKNMSAYLKNKFDCFGIKTPLRKEIQKSWFDSLKPLGIDHWDLVSNLWSMQEREYHYIAIDYLRKVPKKYFEAKDHLLIEDLICTHSWWDSVDLIASNTLASYFQLFPEMRDEVLGKWRTSSHLWLMRSCLIFQLKYKDTLDEALLYELIKEMKGIPEFFIQKAIGWSLRSHSRVNPDWVKKTVKELELNGLAKREALRLIKE